MRGVLLLSILPSLLVCFFFPQKSDAKTIESDLSTSVNIYIDSAVEDAHVFDVPVKYDSVFQFFSHGKPGYLYINGNWLNKYEIAEFLRNNILLEPEEIKHINFYGCEFAEGTIGKEAVEYLENQLNVSIAASNDITGKRGDWDLEVGESRGFLSFPDYPFSLQTGPNDDFDGDGIANINDIDDDNDGVPDLDEQSCAQPLFDFTVQNNLNGVTTPLLTESGATVTTSASGNVFPLNGAQMGPQTQYGLSSNGDVVTLRSNTQASAAAPAIATMNFSQPVSNFEFTIWNITRAGIIPTDENVRVTAFYQGVQVPLTSQTTGSQVSYNATTRFFSSSSANTNLANSTASLFYRSQIDQLVFEYHAQGRNTITDANGINIFFGDESGCTDLDTDNDGNPNRLDLDSDNDGCSDAFEAGATTDLTTDFQFPTTGVGVNGLPNVVETAPDSGTINYVSTYQSYAVNPFFEICNDFDNDGIADFIDIDDDNDGVPDVKECTEYITVDADLLNLMNNINFTPGESTLFTNVGGVNGFDVLVEPEGNFFFPPEFQTDGQFTNFLTTFNGATNSYTISFVGSVLPGTISIVSESNLFSRNTAGNSINEQMVIEVTGDGPIFSEALPFANVCGIGSFRQPNVNVNATQDVHTYIMPRPGSGGFNSCGFRSEFEVASGATSIKITYTLPFGQGGDANTVNPFRIALAMCYSDTDGDGIQDKFDLDSDGDGCSDALESGATTNTTTDYQFPNIDSNGDGLVDAVDTNSDGQVDYPSTYFQYALDNKTGYCIDSDSDGILDITDLDDDNDGVLDVQESCSDGLSLGTPFTDISQASGITSPGIYFFRLNGNEFSTFVDENGYVKIAVDYGYGVGTLPQGNSINNLERGILNPQILASLTGIEEVRINDSGGFLDAITTEAAIIDRLVNNQTLHIGQATNGINNNWTGSNAQVITVNASSNTPVNQRELHQTIIHTSGNANGMLWKPITNSQAVENSNTEIAYNDYMSLWVKGGSPVFGVGNGNCDIDNDGLLNHLDPDADGDGCSDAIEAGATTNLTPEFIFDIAGGASTDVNGNGLADEVEEGTSGNLNYISTFTQFGLDANIGICLDFDGDGILDFIDIDDDNDGVLDKEEACPDGLTKDTPFINISQARSVTAEGIYYFEINGNAFSTFVDSNGFIQIARDFGNGVGSLPQGTSLNRIDRGILNPITLASLENIEEVRISDNVGFLDATTNNQVIIDRVNSNTTFQVGNNNAANDDWVGDNAQWLTANGTSAQNPTNLDARVFHTVGNVNGFHWIPSTNFQRYTFNSGEIPDDRSLIIWVRGLELSTATIACDLDGDGVLNQFDLDSDGDGCSDAFESGATTNDSPDFQFPSTAVGTNGLANTLETVSDSGEINYTSTYLEYGVNTSIDACLDTDADGIRDVADLDDDNDGILDTEECTPVTISRAIENITSSDSPNQIIVTNVRGYGFDIVATSTGTSGFLNNADDNQFGIGDASNINSPSIISSSLPNALRRSNVTFEFFETGTNNPVVVDFFELTLYDLDVTETTGNFSVAPNEIIEPPVESNYTISTDPINGIYITTGNGNDFDTNGPNSFSRFGLVFENISSISFTAERYISGGNLGVGIQDLTVLSRPLMCDEDQDGIFNQVDLDSDGDGCSDAFEGDGGFVGNDLTTSNIDGGNSGDEFNGYGAPVELNLGNDVDTNPTSPSYGVPIIAGAGQNIGNAQTLDPDADSDGIGDTCDCFDNTLTDTDGDGVPDEDDVDSDNDGIFDAVEGDETVDTDSDGIPDYLDLDSDNDGIPDTIEALGDNSIIDCSYSDGDVIDPTTLCETGESSAGEITPIDTDGDTIPDYLDLDSDGDTCPDGLEAEYAEVNVNTVDFSTVTTADVDPDGLVTAIGCNPPSTNEWIDNSISDACCEIDETTLIATPFAPSTCSPANDGFITVNGGNLLPSTNYLVSYLQNGAAVTNVSIPTQIDGSLTINGLIPAQYADITITSVQYPTICSGTVPVVLTVVPEYISDLNAVVTSTTDVTCFGEANGAINISATGENGNFQYSWIASNGGVVPAGQETNEDLTGLVAGNYFVTITDLDTQCVETLTNITINEPTAAVSGTFTQTNVLCNGDNSGAINLTPAGGTSPYTYAWTTTDGIIPVGQEDNQDISNLTAGTYSVVITDANGCTNPTPISVTITEPAAVVSGSTTSTDVLCNGDSTGSIDLTPAGGVAPYTFAWNTTNGTIPAGQNTNEDLTGLVAGTYTVVITDSNGCTNPNAISVQVSEPSNPITSTISQTNVACFGDSTGAINITPSGGTAPYTFAWSSPSGADITGQETNEDLTGLAAGTYSVTIIDANGCTFTPNDIIITQPAAPVSATVTATDVLCNGDASGSIDLSPTGGTAPYTYLWTTTNGNIPNGLEVTEDPTNLTAGSYSVTITDANGCTNLNPIGVTIAEPTSVVSGTLTPVNLTCNGDFSGSIDATPSGGTGGYTFLWTASNGGIIPTGQETNEDLSGLSAGTYSVVITDANGCTNPIALSTTLTEPDVIMLTETISAKQNVTCIDQNIGAFTVVAEGGSESGFVYELNTGASNTTGVFTGLAAGDYTVTVTDDQGCTAPNPLVITVQNFCIEATKTQTIADTDGSGTTNPSDVVIYSILVTNNGEETLTGVAVTDVLTDALGNTLSLDSGPTYVAGSATLGSPQGTLQVNESATYTASYTLSQSDIDAGGISNSATATGNGIDVPQVSDVSDNGNDADGNTTDDPTDFDITEAPEIELVKLAAVSDEDNSNTNNAGDIVTFTFTLENTGNVTVSNLLISDDLTDAEGNTLSLSTPISFVSATGNGTATSLAPLEIATYTATYTLTQADVDAGGISNTATASGITEQGTNVSDVSDDGVAGNGDDNPTEILITEDPSLTLIKTAGNVVDLDSSGDDTAGDRITYTFSIENTGNVTIDGLVLTDNFLPASTNLTLPDTSIAPGEIINFSANYILVQTDINTGNVTNSATISGNDPDGNVVTDVSDNGDEVADDDNDGNPENDPTIVDLTTIAEIELVKIGVFNDENGDGFAQQGETITYSFTVTNTGNIAVENVTVDDPALGVTALATTPTNLPIGVSGTIPDQTYTIQQADIDAGLFSNTATATGERSDDGTDVSDTSDDGNPTNGPDNPTVVEFDQNAELSLIKQGVYSDDNGDGLVNVGDIITYTFTVENTGNVTVDNTSIDDARIGITDEPIYTDATETTVVTSLAPSETAVSVVVYTITLADVNDGNVTNTALATGQDPEGDDVTATSDNGTGTGATIVDLPKNPILELTKTAVLADTNGSGSNDAGDVITYTFSVENTGNVTVNTLRINDPTLGITNLGVIPAALAPGATGSVTSDYTITQADVNAGGITNTATVGGLDPDGVGVSDVSDNGTGAGDDPTVTPLTKDPSIEVSKIQNVVDSNGDGITGGLSDVVTYTITVTNTGNVTLTNVSVVDMFTAADGTILNLDSGPSFVSASSDNVEGILQPSEIAIYTAAYTIQQIAIDGGGLNNEVTATGEDPENVEVSDTLDTPTVFTITETPSVVAIKTASINDVDNSGTNNAGDIITYTITVENTGNVTLNSVSLTETFTDADGNALTLDGGPTFVSASEGSSAGSLQVGEIATYTANYTLTQDDINVGGVLNSVLAEGTSPAGTVVDDISDDGDTGTGDTGEDPTTTEIPKDAGLTLIKRITNIADTDGSGDNNIGDVVTYNFTIENTGNVTVNGITLTDNFLPGTTDLTVTPNSLEPGETATVVAQYALTQGDVDAGQITNSASVEGTDPDGDIVSDVSDDGNPADSDLDPDTDGTNDPTFSNLTTEATVELIKTAVFNDENGNNRADVNETITYSFEIINTGNITLENITLDDVPLGLTDVAVSPASLGPNQSGAAPNADYVITQADINNGSVSNTATAFGDRVDDGQEVSDISSDDNPASGPDEPTVTEFNQEGEISLLKEGTYEDTNNDGVVNVGDQINYEFTVTNTGNVTITGLVIQDTRIGIAAPGIILLPATLNPGAVGSQTVAYNITQADLDSGSISNTATAIGQEPNGDDVTAISNNNNGTGATVVGLEKDSEIQLVKTSEIIDLNGSGVDDIGDVIEYTFTVTNVGNVTVEIISIADATLGISNLGITPSTLAPGEIGVATANYTITQSDLDAGEVVNTATATGSDPDGDPVTDESDDDPNDPGDNPTVTPLTAEPSIEVLKTQSVADTNSDGTSGNVDDLITYTISVENTGNVSLSNVILTDTFTDALGNTLSLNSGPTFVNSSNGSLAGNLQPTEIATYTANYTITQAAVNAGGVSNTVLVIASPPTGADISDVSDDGIAANGNDNPTEFNITENPSIEVVKTGIISDEDNSNTDNAGDIINYEITIENTGNVTITGIVLTDVLTDLDAAVLALSTGPTFDDSSLNSSEGTLLPGETATYLATFLLTQSEIDAGGVINSATAEGTTAQGTTVNDDSDDGNPTNGTDTPTTTQITKSAELTLIKTSDAFEVIAPTNDGNYQAGDQINYSFSIENTGNLTVSGLTLVDVGLGATAGDLVVTPAAISPGDFALVTYTYTLTQDDIDLGQVENTATVSGTDPDGVSVSDVSDNGDANADTNFDGNPENDPTITLIPSEAEIELVKIATVNDGGDGRVDAGDGISYEFTVTNTGALTLDNILLNDAMLGIIDFTVPLTIPTGLAPGDSETFTDASFNYTITQDDIDSGSFENQATVTADDPSDNEVSDLSDNGNNLDGPNNPTIVNFTQEPDLSLDKTGVYSDDNLDGVVNSGDIITYTFTVENTGNVTLDNLQLTDDFLPVGIDLTLLDTELAPMQQTILSVDYTITQADMDAGGVTNEAEVAGTDPNDDAVTASDDHFEELLKAPSLELLKTSVVVDTNGNGIDDVGDTVEYSFTVTNTGNVSVEVLTIGDATLGISNLGVNPSNLSPGGVGTATASYTITQADIDAGQVINTAVVSGSDPDGDSVTDNSDGDPGSPGDQPTTTPFTQAPEIEVTKTQQIADTNSDGVTGGIDDVITYTITVVNTGNVTLNSLSLVDTFVDGNNQLLTLTTAPTFVAAASDIASETDPLPPGNIAVYTANYTIAQEAIDAAGVSNSVEASGTAPDTSIVSDISDNGIDTDGNTEDDSTDFEIPENPDIEVVKIASVADSDGSGTTNAGDIITYTISVENTGNVTLNSVSLTDTFLNAVDAVLVLDNGPTFVSASNGSSEGDLLPNEIATYTADYTLTQDDIDVGGVKNSVLGEGLSPINTAVSDVSDNGNDADGNTEDDATETSIDEDPSIEVEKLLTPIVNPVAGDVITFTINATNTGNVTLNSITLEDTFTDARGEDLTLDALTFSSSTSGSLEGILQINEIATYIATYTLTQTDIDAGGVTNSVLATGTSIQNTEVSDVSDDGDDADGNTTNDKTNLVIPESPNIVALKQAVVNQNDGNGTVDVGDEVAYTITITNTGNVTLRNLVLEDVLSDFNGNLLTLNTPPIFNATASTNTTEGIIAPSESSVYNASYIIQQSDVDAGGISNSATVTTLSPNNIVTEDVSDDGNPADTDPDGDPENDPTETEIIADPSIKLVKAGVENDEDGDNCTDVGETITYTFTVTNDGNVSLSTINLTDNLSGLGPINFVSGDTDSDSVLDVTETWVYNANYTIQQADLDLGSIANNALVSGISPAGNTVDDISGTATTNDTATTIDFCLNPEITFVKTSVTNDGGDGRMDAGDTIEYTFTVTNTGNVTVDNILIDDPQIGITNLSLVPSSLASGETGTVTAVYTITQNNLNTGSVTNEAIATGQDPDGDDVTDTSDDGNGVDDNGDGDPEDPTVTPLPSDPELTFVKSSVTNDGGDGRMDVGDTIEYTFTVTNTGNVTVSGITIEDVQLGVSNLSILPSNLAPGSTGIATRVYQITQADIDAGSVSNSAIATGTAPDGDPVEDTSDTDDPTDPDPDGPTVTPLPSDPELTFVKSAVTNDGGDGRLDAGDTIEYTFTVTNSGNVSVNGITIDDSIIGVSGQPIIPNDLSAGETGTATAVYTITQADIDAGSISNSAIATGTAPDGDPVEDTSDTNDPTDPDPNGPTITPLPSDPELTFVKSAVTNDGGDGRMDIGDTIEYTFAVTNTGNVSVNGITIDDSIIGVSGQPIIPNDLSADETGTATAVYTVTQADIDVGSVSNSAIATGTAPDGDSVEDTSDTDDPTDPDPDGPTVTPLPSDPELTFVKSSVTNDGGDGRMDAGDTIEYTFTVTNTGNVTVSGITIDDSIIGLSGQPIVPSNLSAGETGTATAVYTITQADIDAGSISNSAVAIGISPDGDPVEDTSDTNDPTDPDPDGPTVTPLSPQSNLALEKTGIFNDENGNGFTDIGETITYNFTIENTGNTTVENITITDVLVPVQGGPISLAPGELDTASFTATYVVSEADISAGLVTNSAIAEGQDPNGNSIIDTSDDPSNPTDQDEDGDGDPEDPTETIIPPRGDASLEATKVATVNDVDGNGFTTVGDIINYSITVENTGEISLSGIILDDVITDGDGTPLQLTFGPSFVGATMNSSEGNLQATEIATYSASYIITEEDAITGTIQNSVTVSAQDTNGNTISDVSDDGDDTDGNTEDDATEVEVISIDPAPPVSGVEVTKTAIFTDDGDGRPSQGDIIDYTVTIENIGETLLDGLQLLDVIENGNGDALNLTVPLTFSNASLGSSEGTLLAGETATYLASYTVSQNDVNSNSISNYVVAEAENPDGDSVTDRSDDGDDTDGNIDDDPTEVIFGAQSSISLMKEVVFNDENGDGLAEEGETLSYSFTVRNTGDVDLFDVTLTDDLPGVTLNGNPIDMLPVGSENSANYSATYTLTETDVENAFVENQALVTAIDTEGRTVSDLSDDPINPTDNDQDGDGEPDDVTTIDIEPRTDCQVIVYDIISPDGDGIADELTIDGLDCYPENTLEIYNRWGIRVFRTEGYNTTGEKFRGFSDGRVTIQRNKMLPTGTYYYVLNYVNDSGVTIRKAGPIFVITD
ncbi:DUF7507 domain-containing protein [Galbibacter mesophilus]|uniref:DUF7507 domain-containing protein n=1 Tax=Galbibacter mesophilus TaxID=379069 RepID=UPI00191F2BEE|nr:gliding motility-associated C-terminal domain-containing protein [Galbibacter mesophilus]MCM5663079.1 gliding motility-associated C-terminal domain-containing protein [Galbibacter mesophilus]